jgi:hypothetical protein
MPHFWRDHHERYGSNPNFKPSALDFGVAPASKPGSGQLDSN